jgi:hypothetical protein
MSEPTAPSVAVAVLLAVLPSFVAPVVPETVDDPAVVGIPVTEHTMLPLGATDVGGVGAHVNASPAGSPVTAQDAAVAATAGAAAFLQVNEPV